MYRLHACRFHLVSQIVVLLEILKYQGTYLPAGADQYMHYIPKPSVLDYNLYYSAGPDGTVAMKPNITVATSLFGIDVHSVIDQDPLLDMSNLGAVHVREGSPALKLGFVNFPYGPRT